MNHAEFLEEIKIAEEKGFVVVPPDKCGLYQNTYVFNPTTKDLRDWRGDCTSVAGRIAYPIYVRKEHFDKLTVSHSGPEAFSYAFSHGLIS